ncbi:PQQ-like beta-propeller repeat protein [Stieleria sp. JC731]|uniref:outer membrane protein assembly factor BamB family protein n=1 Tax=Pirellulaceae TaxID=2691357 RepID=UPI001E48E805|nr:PQQ-binding-like beta-propeller repeat protein [Stieleria sp. JC731]MCC9603689.1 PQQ-like beta-propeller repeat protein [Stieleria sp. JC731]
MPKHDSQPYSASKDDVQSPGRKSEADGLPSPRRSLFRAFMLLLAAVAVAIGTQWAVPDFDQQNANLIGMGAIALAVLYLLFVVYRIDFRAGNQKRIPLFLASILVISVVLFRFEGFSGTMFPLFSWRFADGNQYELESLVDSEIAPSANGENESISPAFDSPQFLGPARNGVYPRRVFDIPSDPKDVKISWSHGIGQGWSAFAVEGEYAVTLEQRGDKECLSCYDLGDGKLIWIVEHEGYHHNTLGGTGPRSTPTIVDGKVYATTATGWLCCVGLADGSIDWSTDLFELAGWTQVEFEAAAPWGYAPSPLVVGNLCIVPLGGPVVNGSFSNDQGASLVAFNRVDGEMLWKAGSDQLSYASPMLMTFDGLEQVVSVNEKTVTGHDVETGRQLWEFDWPGSTNTGATCAAAVYVADDQVLVGKGYSGGSALVKIEREGDGWTTEDQWRSSRVLKTKFNHTCVDGIIGYGISNGSLQAVSLEEPDVYWTQPRRNRSGEGHAVLVDDVLVVQDEEGDLVFVSAAVNDYVELLRLEALSSKTWNIPCVSGRYILVRNDRQVICYEMPAIDFIPADEIEAALETGMREDQAETKQDETTAVQPST